MYKMFGFFDATVIEQMMKNNRAPKVPDDDFDTYFNRRYLEEIKPFTETPSFSLKYFMAMSHIRQNVYETCKKEYISKYNLSSDYFDKYKISLNTHNKKNVDNIQETQFGSVVENENENEIGNDVSTGLRRSARLKNKN